MFFPNRAPLPETSRPILDYAKVLGPGDLLPVAARTKIPSTTVNGAVRGFRWNKDFVASIQDVLKWSLDPETGWGLQGRNYIGLDLDINDAALADQIEELARDYLGAAPVRLRDGSPRRLLVYRRARDEPYIKKMRLAWTDRNGAAHAVEVLGYGQFYVVEGVHPSGARYRWRDNESLVEVGPVNLTEIDAAALRRFFNGAA